jgi:hypothetical protein
MVNEPVATVQVGCVTFPNAGVAGTIGAALTVADKEADEVQVPLLAVTV